MKTCWIFIVLIIFLACCDNKEKDDVTPAPSAITESANQVMTAACLNAVRHTTYNYIFTTTLDLAIATFNNALVNPMVFLSGGNVMVNNQSLTFDGGFYNLEDIYSNLFSSGQAVWKVSGNSTSGIPAINCSHIGFPSIDSTHISSSVIDINVGFTFEVFNVTNADSAVIFVRDEQNHEFSIKYNPALTTYEFTPLQLTGFTAEGSVQLSALSSKWVTVNNCTVLLTNESVISYLVEF